MYRFKPSLLSYVHFGVRVLISESLSQNFLAYLVGSHLGIPWRDDQTIELKKKKGKPLWPFRRLHHFYYYVTSSHFVSWNVPARIVFIFFQLVEILFGPSRDKYQLWVVEKNFYGVTDSWKEETPCSTTLLSVYWDLNHSPNVNLTHFNSAQMVLAVYTSSDSLMTVLFSHVLLRLSGR